MMEAQRIKQRVEYDLEMIKELGYCSGIENYSRYFDGRAEGQERCRSGRSGRTRNAVYGQLYRGSNPLSLRNKR